MKNKAFLPLMEQMCMIALFSIVAAVCLRGFALAKEISNKNYVQDMAVTQAQNMAELIKNSNGDLEELPLESGNVIYYNKEWVPVNEKEQAIYSLVVTELESGHSLLGKAQIEVYSGAESVYKLTVGWQEGM